MRLGVKGLYWALRLGLIIIIIISYFDSGFYGSFKGTLLKTT